ncbi:CAP and S-layer homology domain-containing protein [Salisediminibacterium selenitireducens]|uniref:S-layer domain protein n=1 Tax=Bacillus selenitireducens (strain ATCC 700615 / DSM 15326 / MLS10) TaxID=439292 RepID=D6XZJ6_BACIE|nr:S-layer homology domain-containing protein [Salisediminibacterium selenitireducens]ADH98370.1 S-layer domain protein [[Bacillus] selenitireducens MLS10]
MIKKYIAFLIFAVSILSCGLSPAAESSPFTDPLAERYKDDVLSLYDLGIIGGFPDGSFKPDNDISRGAAAIMVARSLGFVDLEGNLLIETSADSPSFNDVYPGTSYYNALIALEEQGVVRGNPDGTFGPDDEVTRGAMAIMLANGFELAPVGHTNPFQDLGASSMDAVQALYDYAITSGISLDAYGTDQFMIRSDFSVMVRASMQAGHHTIEAEDALLLLEEVRLETDQLHAGGMNDEEQQEALTSLKALIEDLKQEQASIPYTNPLRDAIDTVIMDSEATLPDESRDENGEEEPEDDEPVTGYQPIDVLSSELSVEERELANLINDYRVSLGLEPLKLSVSMTQVARSHVNDSNLHSPERAAPECNLHSWSANGDWSPVCYTSDHANASGMWDKPYEITDGVYNGSGYEISVWASNGMTAERALSLWQSSPAHDNVIIGDGYWSNLTVMGISVKGNYSHVWFGTEDDPAGYFNE